jgi:hypothetical protein
VPAVTLVIAYNRGWRICSWQGQRACTHQNGFHKKHSSCPHQSVSDEIETSVYLLEFRVPQAVSLAVPCDQFVPWFTDGLISDCSMGGGTVASISRCPLIEW